MFTLTRPTSRRPPGRYLSGGVVSDIFDVLRTGEFAVGGLLSGKGVRRGVAERTESAPEFKRLLLQAGAPDNFATKAGAFVASLVVDPINLIGFTGLGRAAVSGIGKAGSAVIGRTLPGVARGMAAGKALEPILERAAIGEARGIETALDVGRQLRKDAQRLAGRRGRDLDKSVGAYFDAGADTMLGRIAQGQTVQVARQAASTAQQAYLATLPADVRTFVQKWIPQLAKDDADLAQNLVRVGMMSPQTAVKWEGVHLRRIYEKFEDPHAFAEFLQRTDPAEAARLLGKLERGIPIAKIGQPIPTAVVKQRKVTTAVRRGELGEIQEASSRYVSGRVLAERAIARGEAYADIATKFSVPDALVRQQGLPVGVWRQMHDTGGWGALAGRWLPKEIADPLLRSVRVAGGVERFLETTTGWFKFAKVILNPATHFRNIRTNISLAHNAAGLGALNPVTWVRAANEVRTNGRFFQEAKAASAVFVDTFTNSEIRQFTAQGGAGLIRRLGAPFARMYQFEEQAGKMAVYLTVRGRGLSPQAAGKVAELALFNYRKVPFAIDRMRRIGIYPFITFPYKVATQTIPKIIENPGRMAAQAKVIGRISEPLTEEEQRVLPLYMRTGGYIKLPGVKVNGHPVLYDLTYELAFGDVAEAGTPAGTVLAALRGELPPSDAVFSLLPPAVQVVAELALNRNAFLGREIIPPGETKKEAAKIAAAYAARFAAPGIVSKAALPGGELLRAVRQQPTPSGIPAPPVSTAIASSLFGLKTRPLDVRRERQSRAFELERSIQDVQKRMTSVATNRAITPQQRQVRLDELRRELLGLVEQYRTTGAVRQ